MAVEQLALQSVYWAVGAIIIYLLMYLDFIHTTIMVFQSLHTLSGALIF